MRQNFERITDQRSPTSFGFFHSPLLLFAVLCERFQLWLLLVSSFERESIGRYFVITQRNIDRRIANVKNKTQNTKQI